ncbi:hypothetical protein GCM10017687_66420 [Streptomyces echinatus]|uniref:GAF domain-containing protein n=1 Tax=Streptomyces echinatus TaxID=67293 RepID=A0A7W9PQ73_9ACTN|nr:hypothetical protein [Streptomyces echinatus]
MSRDHLQPAPSGSAEAPYLDLLARDASVEAYERPVLLARAEGEPAGRLAALEEARLLALRVRAELEGRRRREAELSALFETAHDLAGLRDLDAVLRAIVQRARSLLGTDVAYLSLNDPARGDTYMRVTEGSVAARFQQLRLGMGEGLGGLVAQTARPYVTDDLGEHDRIRLVEETVVDREEQAVCARRRFESGLAHSGLADAPPHAVRPELAVLVPDHGRGFEPNCVPGDQLCLAVQVAGVPLGAARVGVAPVDCPAPLQEQDVDVRGAAVEGVGVAEVVAGLDQVAVGL